MKKFNRVKALILYKKSTLNRLKDQGISVRKSLTGNKGEIERFRSSHKNHYDSLKKVEAVLRKWNIAYKKASRGGKFNIGKGSIVIAVGGDGTFLEAAKNIKNELILGVNSDTRWSVGRYCSTNKDTFEGTIKKITSKTFKIKYINRLRIRFMKTKKVYEIVNDVLICHRNPAAMSRYKLSVGTMSERHRSSGLWVATASGSTGGIRSAGGRVLPPGSDKLQYKVRELYYEKGLKYKLTGAVLPRQAKIRVMSFMEDGVIFVDGANTKIPFGFGEVVQIGISPHPLRVIGK